MDAGDGTGESITPRLVVVKVDEVIAVREGEADPAATVRVVDGYWMDRVGYERESIGWLEKGQTGYFFVSRDVGPDGSPLATLSPITSGGIVRVRDGEVDRSESEPWVGLGHDMTLSTFQRSVSDGVREVASGTAHPILETVCHPSIAGDENSEPECVTQ